MTVGEGEEEEGERERDSILAIQTNGVLCCLPSSLLTPEIDQGLTSSRMFQSFKCVSEERVEKRLPEEEQQHHI